MALTPEEIERYKRHLVLREVGGQGQQKIKAAKVLVVGAGGLGSPLLHVSGGGRRRHHRHHRRRPGLARQPAAPDRARHRSMSAPPRSRARGDMIARLNPHVRVEANDTRIDAGNALEIIAPLRHRRRRLGQFRHPLPRQRRLLSRQAHAGVRARSGPFDGYVTTFKPHERGPDGKPYPSYRCIFPEAPPPGTVANCAEVGVLGAAVGVIGTLQATEVLKEIVGIGESLAGRLLLYDARAARFNEIKIAWDPANPLSGKTPTIRDLSIHAGGQQGAVCAA